MGEQQGRWGVSELDESDRRRSDEEDEEDEEEQGEGDSSEFLAALCWLLLWGVGGRSEEAGEKNAMGLWKKERIQVQALQTAVEQSSQGSRARTQGHTTEGQGTTA